MPQESARLTLPLAGEPSEIVLAPGRPLEAERQDRPERELLVEDEGLDGTVVTREAMARDERGFWVGGFELEAVCRAEPSPGEFGRLLASLPRRCRLGFEIHTEPSEGLGVDRVFYRVRVATKVPGRDAAALIAAVHAGLGAYLPNLRFGCRAATDLADPRGLHERVQLGRPVAAYQLAYGAPRSGSRMGFWAGATSDRPAQVSSIPVPAEVTPAPVSSLVSLLLGLPGRAVLCFEIRPARLRQSEVRAIDEQMRLCEAHAQSGLIGAATNPALLGPSRLASARALERRLADREAALRDSAFDLRATLHTNVAVPQATCRTLARALGLETQREPSNGSRSLFTAQEAARALPLPRPGECLPGLAIENVTRFPLPATVPPSSPAVAELLGPRGAVRFGFFEMDRARHLYVSGRTGAGKSTLLARLALLDMAAGDSIVVIDPHGDLCADLLDRVPPSRADDVVLIDPMDVHLCPSLNPLAFDSLASRRHAIAGFLAAIERLAWDQYGDAAAPMTGPVFWQFLTMVTEAVTTEPNGGATVADIVRFCEDPAYRKALRPGPLASDRVRRWLANISSLVDFERPGSDSMGMGTYLTSKLEPCLNHPALRRLLCSPAPPLDLGRALDRGSILLVNLARGELGEQGSRFFGMMFLSRLVSACFERAGHTRRRPFRLLIDEFGSLATRSVATLLAEGRKFGASLTLANQYTDQMRKEVAEAVFANCGGFVAFRASASDARRLAEEIGGGLTPEALSALPAFHAYAGLTLAGRQSSPLTLRTLPLDPPRAGTAETIRDRCRREYRA